MTRRRSWRSKRDVHCKRIGFWRPGPVYRRCLGVVGVLPSHASVTFTANASDSGVLALYIAGVLVSLAVLPSHAPGALATALTAKINAAVDLPVTAKVDSTTPGKPDGQNKGLAASDIDVRLNYLGNAGGETLPAGLGVTLRPIYGRQTWPELLRYLCVQIPRDHSRHWLFRRCSRRRCIRGSTCRIGTRCSGTGCPPLPWGGWNCCAGKRDHDLPRKRLRRAR